MKLPDSRLGVLVSLPRNDVALAQAARRAGANGLKVHVSLNHRASGTVIGPLAAERSRLQAILDQGLPVGLVVGTTDAMTRELEEAAGLGFDYVDLYAADAPANYVAACRGVTPMVALGPGDGAAQARALVGRGVGALELSTLEPERYGTPLSLATLARLESVAAAVDVPVILPSQHRLAAADLGLVREAGAAAVLLGAVVLGEDVENYEARLDPYVRAAQRG